MRTTARIEVGVRLGISLNLSGRGSTAIPGGAPRSCVSVRAKKQDSLAIFFLYADSRACQNLSRSWSVQSRRMGRRFSAQNPPCVGVFSLFLLLEKIIME